jgi:uncharacterized protein (TIGR03435 family)
MPFLTGVIDAPGVQAEAVYGATPKWEVASIRRGCDAGAGGNSKGATPQISSPGRLSACSPVAAYITSAYITFANGRFNPGEAAPVEGGPSWINADRYQINAKAEGTPPMEMLIGPMLAALLEDRFKLKLHREAREIPVYDLTVAKSGLKLKPVEPDSCAPVDFNRPVVRDYPQPGAAIAMGKGVAPLMISLPPAPGQKPSCGSIFLSQKGLAMTLDMTGATFDDFCKVGLLAGAGSSLDRPVIDKTGVPGRFHIHLEFAREGDPAADPSGVPSIFTAVQEQLGLKLEPAKGPGDRLVIDSVDRPTEN